MKFQLEYFAIISLLFSCSKPFNIKEGLDFPKFGKKIEYSYEASSNYTVSNKEKTGIEKISMTRKDDSVAVDIFYDGEIGHSFVLGQESKHISFNKGLNSNDGDLLLCREEIFECELGNRITECRSYFMRDARIKSHCMVVTYAKGVGLVSMAYFNLTDSLFNTNVLDHIKVDDSKFHLEKHFLEIYDANFNKQHELCMNLEKLCE